MSFFSFKRMFKRRFGTRISSLHILAFIFDPYIIDIWYRPRLDIIGTLIFVYHKILCLHRTGNGKISVLGRT